MLCQDGSENSIRDFLADCLLKQLSEYELLKSMYPDSDTMLLTNPKELEDVNCFLSNSSNSVPPHLDFILKMNIDKLKLEISINLPSFYPDKEEPVIYVRCNQLNRVQESNLNAKLSKYIKENHTGEAFLYTAITWLNEYVIEALSEIKETIVESAKKCVNDRFARMWIYSHHIYNKRKRDEIIHQAHEFNLTGFCLSGKPGIVCIEGAEKNCNDWWKIIKAMNWKKIGIRKTELYDTSEQNVMQKFLNFKEINLSMGEFSKYLHDNGLTYAFQDIFGFNED